MLQVAEEFALLVIGVAKSNGEADFVRYSAIASRMPVLVSPNTGGALVLGLHDTSKVVSVMSSIQCCQIPVSEAPVDGRCPVPGCSWQPRVGWRFGARQWHEQTVVGQSAATLKPLCRYHLKLKVVLDKPRARREMPELKTRRQPSYRGPPVRHFSQRRCLLEA